MNFFDEIILVGKMYKRDCSNGPTAVMYALQHEFNKSGIKCTTRALSEDITKIQFLIRLAGLIKVRNKIINVHINGFVSAMFVLMISRVNKKCDFFLTIHGIYREQIKYYKSHDYVWLYKKLEKYIYNNFPNIICVSELCKETLYKNFTPKGNIYVIENGIYDMEYVISKKRKLNKLFVFLGGLQEIKGIEQLIFIFDRLVYLDTEVKLKIYGSSTDRQREQFEKNIVERGLKKYVEYGGMLKNRTDIIRAYQEADYHISLSKFDTFNNTIIEAMNYGCVNISNTKSGAAHFIKNRYTGFIINDDVENSDMAELLFSILNSIDVENYNMIATNAKAAIAENGWSNIAKNYISVFGME